MWLLSSGLGACRQQRFGFVLSDADVEAEFEADSDVGECYNCGEVQALGAYLCCQCLWCGGKVMHLYAYTLAERDAKEVELMEEYAFGLALHDVQAANAEDNVHMHHLSARGYASKYALKGLDDVLVTSGEEEFADVFGIPVHDVQAADVDEVALAHAGMLFT